jgi:SAM-dependent methyltransferase
MTDDERIAANAARWDDLADVHPDTDHYDIEGFLAGGSTLREPELAVLPDVAGTSVLHLQCHLGLESLSLSRMGADVVGVDISEQAVRTAREIRDEAELDATFVTSDVYDVPEAIDETFDVVFASYGVLTWVPDVQRWMDVAATMLDQGGSLVLADHHPITHSFDWDREFTDRYFRDDPEEISGEGSYADPDADVSGTTYEWTHGLGEIVTAAANAGLHVETLNEHPYLYFEPFGGLEQDDQGRFRLDGDPLPLVYALKAVAND